jgi:hypothetical protein
VRVNGGGAVSVGGATSHTQNFGTGSYSLEVRAVNKAGAGPWSPASAAGQINDPPPPTNAVVTAASACIVSYANFHAYNNVCSYSASAGTQILLTNCLRQQNGVWWFQISQPWEAHMIRVSDVSTGVQGQVCT